VQWEDISVVEQETERTSCDCCQKVTTLGSVALLYEGEFIGWFSLKFSEASSSHLPVFRIYVGDWSEGAQVDTRWGIGVSWHSEGCTLLDWDEEENNSSFTRLNRNDILGSDFAVELWAMVDAIIMKDSRLKELNL